MVATVLRSARRARNPAGGEVNPPDAATMQVGATWSAFRPSSTMDSTLAASPVQAQHIINFGAGSNLNVTEGGAITWSELDPFVQDLIDAGATTPMLILCNGPVWSRAFPEDPQAAIHPSKVTSWANLCAAIASRYDGTAGRPNIEHFVVWNEMRGYYVQPIGGQYRPGWESVWGSSALSNEWDSIHYTQMYNAVYAAIKAVRPTVNVGGPYVPIDSGAVAADISGGADASAVTFPGGVIDQRALDVFTYFDANATGYDFLCCDGGIENKYFGTPGSSRMPQSPALMIQKFWKLWDWVRDNIHATVPLYWMETYIHVSIDDWAYTLSQVEDLYIQMCREIQENVLNPNGAMLTWMSPHFRPQLVARSSDTVWANTTSGFKAKVDTWHQSGV